MMKQGNVVPDSFIRVMPDKMNDFVRSAFLKAGLDEEMAQLMADALVAADLRGVFSHGTKATGGYARLFMDGKLNPRAQITVERETATMVHVDGDGGLGYAPSFKAVRMAVEKARSQGVAVATTCNHGHFGAAGHYTRRAVDAGCVGLAVSSHHREYASDISILHAGGASPISIGVPAGEQPPLVIDMATAGASSLELFDEMQGAFFKMLGFGLVCHALGGIVAGLVSREAAGPRQWEGVNQGAFFLVIDLGQLIDPATHRRQMDDFIAGLRQLQPAPGLDRTDAPGGLEHEYESEWARAGIPVGDEHQETLQRAAADLGLSTPW